MYIYWQNYFHLKKDIAVQCYRLCSFVCFFFIINKNIQLYQHIINKDCKSKRYPIDTFSTRSRSCTNPENFLRRGGGVSDGYLSLPGGTRHILVILRCNLEKYEFCRRALNPLTTPSLLDPRMLPFCFILFRLIIRVSLDSCW